MKFLLGKKLHMTQVFGENGAVSASTIIEVEPMKVTQIRTSDKDGYTAVQVGFGTQKAKRINKAQKGHSKDLGEFEGAREFRVSDTSTYKEGDTLDLSQFTVGDKVNVSGISKGKGFQGAVKRHGFAGGRRSHGQKHSEREVGSIGIGGIQRVLKGQLMPGRMGNDRVSVKNLNIVHIDTDKGVIIVKGAIPGRTGTLVEIKKN